MPIISNKACYYSQQFQPNGFTVGFGNGFLSIFTITLIFFTLFSLFTVNSVFGTPQLYHPEGEFQNIGKILFLSPATRSIAIDTIDSEPQRVISGKIAYDAMLMRANNRVDLQSFKEGDVIQVAWRVQARKTEILSIIAANGRKVRTKKSHVVKTRKRRPVVIQKISANRPIKRKLAQRQKAIVAKKTTIVPTAKKVFLSSPKAYSSNNSIILGTPKTHRIGLKETLLDIARNHDLGFNELGDLYPNLDPWLPPLGTVLHLPTERIVPNGSRNGILINVPEMRLYYFPTTDLVGKRSIITHPVSVGNRSHPTPTGRYSIANKITHPTWIIPPSLRPKYNLRIFPPGPDNPLGKYWMGLTNSMLGIHGTNTAWSIGRTTTNGCIRMYPEDIDRIFPTISIKTPVRLTYQPIKIATKNNKVYIEVHRDVYGITRDMNAHAKKLLMLAGLYQKVDRAKLNQVIKKAGGDVVEITGK